MSFTRCKSIVTVLRTTVIKEVAVIEVSSSSQQYLEHDALVRAKASWGNKPEYTPLKETVDHEVISMTEPVTVES